MDVVYPNNYGNFEICSRKLFERSVEFKAKKSGPPQPTYQLN